MYSIPLAYILWLLSGFGALGFHRFYLGKIPTGLLFMFTGGLFGLGCVYDFLTLPFQVIGANQRILNRSQNRQNRQSPFRRDPDDIHPGRENRERPVGPGTGDSAAVDSGTGEYLGGWAQTGPAGTAVPADSTEKIILKAARRNRGLASPSELALEADIELDTAKEELEALANKGYCELRVKKTGALTYYFPDFADSSTPEELEPFYFVPGPQPSSPAPGLRPRPPARTAPGQTPTAGKPPSLSVDKGRGGG